MRPSLACHSAHTLCFSDLHILQRLQIGIGHPAANDQVGMEPEAKAFKYLINSSFLLHNKYDIYETFYSELVTCCNYSKSVNYFIWKKWSQWLVIALTAKEGEVPWVVDVDNEFAFGVAHGAALQAHFVDVLRLDERPKLRVVHAAREANDLRTSPSQSLAKLTKQNLSQLNLIP